MEIRERYKRANVVASPLYCFGENIPSPYSKTVPPPFDHDTSSCSSPSYSPSVSSLCDERHLTLSRLYPDLDPPSNRRAQGAYHSPVPSETNSSSSSSIQPRPAPRGGGVDVGRPRHPLFSWDYCEQHGSFCHSDAPHSFPTASDHQSSPNLSPITFQQSLPPQVDTPPIPPPIVEDERLGIQEETRSRHPQEDRHPPVIEFIPPLRPLTHENLSHLTIDNFVLTNENG